MLRHFLFPNANPVPTTPDEMAANIAAEIKQTASTVETSASNDTETAKNPDFGAQLAQAGAWWGMLQEQFKQAVSSAIASNDTKTAAASNTPASKTSSTEKKPRASSAGKVVASKPRTRKKPS